MTKEEFIKSVVSDYVKKSDWRVTENSNAAYSMSGLQGHVAGAVISQYALENTYPLEIKRAHKNCSFHIHDLSGGVFQAYCSGWSIKQILECGFNGVAGKIAAKPAKHFDSALGQLMNFLGTLQNEFAGAQALSSFDTYLAPFVKIDNLDPEKVKQGVQEFIFGINQTSRWGNQVPFTNLTFDWVVPEDLKNEPAIIGGKKADFTYGDCQKEVDEINKAFIELMTEGDANGRIFTFPIPTYNITKDFDWETENAKLLFQMTAKYGTPYFANFLNSDMKPSEVRSMCCRLRLDHRELSKRMGGLFGSGEKTGSIGVVTINMPKLGYKSKTDMMRVLDEFSVEKGKKYFFKQLEELMDLASESLEIKRKNINKYLEEGLLPYSKRYLTNFDTYFSTIGLVGMHECCLNFIGKGIDTKEGKDFSLEVLDFMRSKLSDYQEKTNNLYNLEASPAEGVSHRLAKHDKIRYKEIITSGGEIPYYSNSTQLAVDHNGDVFEALEHQDELQCKYTGGTVFHILLGERIPDWRTCKNLIKKVVEQCKMPYISVTPSFSVCPSCGYVVGEHFTCPTCKSECEVYSRVVGYYRPVQNWNTGKKQEFTDRKTFNLN